MAAFTRAWVPIHLAILLAAFIYLWTQSGLDGARMGELWFLIPVGILGAIIANATGTGGGVVFLPVFFTLQAQGIVEFRPGETVAVAFTIQCFGMSVGALNWMRAIFIQNALAWYDRTPNITLQAIFMAPLATGIPALLLTQAFVEIDDKVLKLYFKIFSLALGVILLIFTWAQRRAPKSTRTLHPTKRDLWILMALGLVGGFVTAIFSVGIGEFLAIYLILRRYPTTIAIAVAVWVSVVSVVAGFWDNWFAGLVVLDVALMAVIGALIGGYVARYIAKALGPLWLKTAAAVWIVLSSLYLLVFT